MEQKKQPKITASEEANRFQPGDKTKKQFFDKLYFDAMPTMNGMCYRSILAWFFLFIFVGRQWCVCVYHKSPILA